MTNEQLHVRLAQHEDMGEISSIVNWYIEHTSINFRTKPQSPDEWRGEWEKTHCRYPWLVTPIDERVVGVAYAAPWKPRNAYDWCTEVTVYVERGHHGYGFGRALYTQLIKLLDAQGYRTMLAVISLPNFQSVRLHEAFGFAQAGLLQNVGYKFNKWCDVGLWERLSTDTSDSPRDILPVEAVLG